MNYLNSQTATQALSPTQNSALPLSMYAGIVSKGSDSYTTEEQFLLSCDKSRIYAL